MIDATPHDPDSAGITLDSFLRDVLPELKLALGRQIDQENARALPSRYARLLPETVLVATLRSDAAEALDRLAAELERELTDSCTRHGSLYDRVYRVQLRRSADRDAPLFTISTHAGHEQPPPSAPAAVAAPPAPDVGTRLPTPASAVGDGDTLYSIPVSDPDATRVEGLEPAGWESGRWMLVVEDPEGNEHEVFRLTERLTTIGRRSEDPQLRVTLGLSGVPHVSRRQLALLWQGEASDARFRLFNLGLNPLQVGDREVPGAHVARGPLDLESIAPEHTAAVEPGITIRIGERGPVLRIEEVPPSEDDPEATRYE